VKRFFNWNPDRSFFPYHAAKGWVLFYRCGDVEGGRGEVRALVGIENLGPANFASAFSSASAARVTCWHSATATKTRSVSSDLDSLHVMRCA
jgi:hypothetical protein